MALYRMDVKVKALLCITAIMLAWASSVSPAEAGSVKLSSLGPLARVNSLAGHRTEDGAAFIEKMWQAADSLDNYSFNYQMRVFKGNDVSTEGGKLWFKKPRLMRIEVNQGSKKGSLAVLQSDGKVHGRLGGLLKLFSGTLSPNSDLLRSGNGYPMVDSDFASLVRFLKNWLKEGYGSRVTQRAITLDGRDKQYFVLEMFKSAKPDLVLKRVLVDPDSYLPGEWFDFDGGRLLSISTWTNLNANTGIKDDFFKL